MNLDKIYCTQRVADEVPLKLQLFLVRLIEERHKNQKKLDELQIFDLIKDDNNNQIIRHMQESPNFLEELVLIADDFLPIEDCLYIVLEPEKTLISYVECKESGSYAQSLIGEPSFSESKSDSERH